MRKVSSLSNMGYLADAKWTRTPLILDDPVTGSPAPAGAKANPVQPLELTTSGWAEQAAVQSMNLDLDGWITLYAVDANYSQLFALYP